MTVPDHDVASFQAFLASQPDFCRWVVNLSILPERLASVQASVRWPPSFQVSAKLLALLPHLSSLVLVHCSLTPHEDIEGVTLNVASLTLIGDSDSLMLWPTLRCFSGVGKLCAQVRQGDELTLFPPREGLASRLHIHSLVLLDIELCNDFLGGLFYGTSSPTLRSLAIDMDHYFLQKSADPIHRVLQRLSNDLDELRYRFPPPGSVLGARCSAILVRII